MANDDVRITLVLPRDMLDDFDAVAHAEHRSRAAELRRLIEGRIAAHKKTAAEGGQQHDV